MTFFYLIIISQQFLKFHLYKKEAKNHIAWSLASFFAISYLFPYFVFAREDLTLATTFSTVNPYSWNSLSAGADAPK